MRWVNLPALVKGGRLYPLQTDGEPSELGVALPCYAIEPTGGLALFLARPGCSCGGCIVAHVVRPSDARH